MTTKTQRMVAELRAMLAPGADPELAELVASARLASAACQWPVTGNIDPAAVERIVEGLQGLPAATRGRVLAQAPETLMSGPDDLPQRLEGLRLVLAEVRPRLR